MDVKSRVGLYWDRRSKTYDQNVYKSQSAAEHFWKSILKAEIGTGTGFLALGEK